MKYLHLCQLTLILALGLMACQSNKPDAKANEPLSVKTDTVRSAAPLTTLQFPGRVKAAHDVSVAFRVSGTIQSLTVKEGDYVSKGQLLARLDPTDYQVQLNATTAQYNQVKAEAQRIMALYKEGSVSANDYDKARYGLEQISAKLANHRDQLGYTRLTAPFSGYVQSCLFDKGETVGAGMPVVSIISSGQLEVEVNLPASAFVHRSDFQRYTCTFDVFPGRTFSLEPVGVTEKANANQLYTMRLRIASSEAKPLPSAGMSTMVSIGSRNAAADEWIVPENGIVNEKGKVCVYVIRHKRAERCPIVVKQLRANGTALVSSTALNEGDCVVAAGAHSISNGQQVEAMPRIAATNEGGLL